jgi:hypothetical protein
MLTVAIAAAWTTWSLQDDISHRSDAVVELAEKSETIKRLIAARELAEAGLLPARESETRIRKALDQSAISQPEIVEVIVSDEQTLAGQPFKRRDVRIRLNMMTLAQISKLCAQLRTACPAAGFAEMEISAGPPVRQTEPERWNARLVLTEFRYSAE